MNEEIRILGELVKGYQNSYYNGQPEISDTKFDKLWDELKIKDPDNDVFKTVGTDVSKGFSKCAHIINMNSQEKVNTEEEYISWHKKRISGESVGEYKLDGISLELQYEDGRFVKGVTRGDGEIGDVITSNVRKMNGVVETLKDNSFTGGVRGEIVLYKSIFEKYYKPQGYKNPRNMASGLAKQKRGEGCEHLNIIVYDVQHSFNKKLFTTEEEKIDWLDYEEFNVVPNDIFLDEVDIIDYRNDIIKIRDTLEYDIDGIVIKNIEINLEDMKRARPEYQIAFKFDAIEETTILDGVVWNISGNILTPIAVLRPVILNGTTVKKASLVNPDEVRRLDLHFGDEVVVTKRGEIIPKIERMYKNNGGAKIFIPQKYIFDYKSWELEDLGVKLVIKDKDFPLIKYHRLEKWIDKLNIKGFGPALLTKLFEDNWVKEISDFYTFNLNNYLETTNLKKAVVKAMYNLYAVTEITLSKFIGGFDIEGVGEGVIKFAEKEGVFTLEDIRKMSVEQLSKIDGIGPDRAERIVEGLIEHKDGMDAVLNTDKIFIKKMEKKEMGDKGFKGMCFCFTGGLDSMTRDQAQEMVIERGGSCKSSVTGAVTHLITNTPDSGSAKNKKAASMGIPILTEIEFLKMMATR